MEIRHLIGWPSLGQLQSKVCFSSWLPNMFPNHLHIIRPLFYLFLWCSNKYVLYYMYCCIYKVQLCKKCWIPHDDNDSEISFQVWFLLPHCLWTFSGPNTAQEKSSFFFSPSSSPEIWSTIQVKPLFRFFFCKRCWLTVISFSPFVTQLIQSYGTVSC